MPFALVLVGSLAVCGVLTVLALGAHAAGLGRSRRIATVLALFLLGVSASTIWVQTHPIRVFPGGDGPAYDLLGHNLLVGFGFTDGSPGTTLVAQAPYLPTMHREPLYPAFVAAVYGLFGDANWNAAALVQTLLTGALVVLTYFAARQVFGEGPAILAGMLIGASADHADVTRLLLTEPLFIPILISAVAAALLAERTRQLRWFILAGAGFAVAALTRVYVAAFFPVFIVIWALLAARQMGYRSVRGPLLAGFSFMVVLSPWLVRNGMELGVPFVAGRYGDQFQRRALKAQASPEANWKSARAAVYIATNPLSEIVYPLRRFQYGPQYWENGVWDFIVNDANAALKEGAQVCGQATSATTVSTEACETKLALRVAATHMPQFAMQTIFELVRFNFYPLPSRLAAYRNGLTWICFITAGWLLIRRRLKGPLLWLTVFLATYVGLAVQVDTQERYAVPLLPLYYAFSAVGFLAVLQCIGGFVQSAIRRLAGNRLSSQRVRLRMNESLTPETRP